MKKSTVVKKLSKNKKTSKSDFEWYDHKKAILSRRLSRNIKSYTIKLKAMRQQLKDLKSGAKINSKLKPKNK